jgi:glutamine synthetase
MSVEKALKLIKDEGVEFVDLRFADTLGKEHHVTLPVAEVGADLFEEGKPFDGSSIAGWKGIEASDMMLMPDAETAAIDQFFEQKTLSLSCDIIEPGNGKPYDRCPRSLAKRAEAYMKSTGVGDTAFFGPEPEFFIFDSIQWRNDMSGSMFRIHSEEAVWSSEEEYDGANVGHRPGVKGGYFPVPPVDSLTELRNEICKKLHAVGVIAEVHHHEVGTAGQCEIGTRFETLVRRADHNLALKYTVKNVAHEFGKTATFMPKPINGDNGNGMHVHQSLWKDNENIFAGNEYAGLSETALYYIGGLLKHSRALCAITNPTTNSFKRLVPGFEAPVKLAYSARNRSATIRVPHVTSPKARRLELRYPDPLCNPYLGFSAMLLAGLDGVLNRIDPGEAMDKNLYDLTPEENRNIPQICASLEEALAHLSDDRQFLMQGGVFSEDMLNAYIALKEEEVAAFRAAPHPLEFSLYYSW